MTTILPAKEDVKEDNEKGLIEGSIGELTPAEEKQIAQVMAVQGEGTDTPYLV